MKLITTFTIPKKTTATFAGSKLIIKGLLKRYLAQNWNGFSPRKYWISLCKTKDKKYFGTEKVEEILKRTQK